MAGANAGGTCNPVTDGFSSGDPGNIFPFYGSAVYCPTGPGPQGTDCDRITDVMAYDGFLYLWPTNEGLTALQMSNAPVSPAALTITSAGNTATISSGGDFSTLVVAGDVITDTNAAGPNYGQQHVVTEVTGAPPVTTVTLDSAFQPDITTAGAAAIRWGTQTSTPT